MFSSNLLFYRKKTNLSQNELANCLGVTQQYVSFLETGCRSPSVDILLKLSRIFNCTIDELLQEDDSKSNQEDPERVCGNCKHNVGGRIDFPGECALDHGETWSGNVACPEFEKR